MEGNKCVKCIKDPVTGQCYDIKDQKAREDIELLKNNKGTTLYRHTVGFRAGNIYCDCVFISTNTAPVTNLDELPIGPTTYIKGYDEVNYDTDYVGLCKTTFSYAGLPVIVLMNLTTGTLAPITYKHMDTDLMDEVYDVLVDYHYVTEVKGAL